MRGILLVMDVGNTNVVVGLRADHAWCGRWRLSTERGRTADEWAGLLLPLLSSSGYDLRECADVAIASVVPPVTTALREMARTYVGAEPFVVEPGVRTGMRVLVDNPIEVGADRLANTLAAHTLYGGPAIVVDLGTATTLDVISPDGDYLGGAIAPGLRLSAEALAWYAAKLQAVELARPSRAIGRTTVEAMQSGIVLGHAALVEGLVRATQAELGPSTVIGTGGLAGVVAEATEVFDVVDPDLTLEGLRLMHALNRPDGAPQLGEIAGEWVASP